MWINIFLIIYGLFSVKNGFFLVLFLMLIFRWVKVVFSVLLICRCMISEGLCSVNKGFFLVLFCFNLMYFLNDNVENIVNF